MVFNTPKDCINKEMAVIQIASFSQSKRDNLLTCRKQLTGLTSPRLNPILQKAFKMKTKEDQIKL